MIEYLTAGVGYGIAVASGIVVMSCMLAIMNGIIKAIRAAIGRNKDED